MKGRRPLRVQLGESAATWQNLHSHWLFPQAERLALGPLLQEAHPEQASPPGLSVSSVSRAQITDMSQCLGFRVSSFLCSPPYHR